MLTPGNLAPVIIEKAARHAFTDDNQFSQATEMVAFVKPSDTAYCEALTRVGFQLSEPAVVEGQIALRYALPRHEKAASEQSLPMKKSA